ncbi:MAG: deoxyribonuclease IV [Firmicutes bacterium]|nr:deoxyribonuclease IV [Bacillota bacterium]
MILGSHVSFGSKQILESTKEAISYGANTFMFYTGAPQNTVRKNINVEYLEEAKKLMEENNIDINNVVCHAPYIVNLANNKDPEKWQFSINFIKQELKRCDELNVKYMVLHPGSAVGMTHEEGIKNIIDGLNIILKDDSKCMILLETMAGKGNECGVDINEIKRMVDGIDNKDRIGVCLDTCHLNDSGVDMNNFDDYLKEFDKNIGIKKIKCVHINDSKNPISSHKDRHENIGIGTIGFDTLLRIINNEKLKDVPKILETPYIGEYDEDKNRIYPPYKFEIEMIKNGKFNENLLEDIRTYYK